MRLRKIARFLAALGMPLILLAALALFERGVDSLNAGRSQEALTRLTQAIRRSSVACYAAEGSYPEDLDYLKEHYGLQIDEERYTVFYEPVGANLMPQITVLECQP